MIDGHDKRAFNGDLMPLGIVHAAQNTHDAFEGEVDGHQVKVLNAKQLAGGEVLDLTEDIPPNYDFFSEGPGYDAME